MFQVRHQEKKLDNQGKLINLHKEKKLAVWLFPRTGSMLFAKIFQNSLFQCYSYTENEEKVFRDSLHHHHHFYIFPEMQNYKLILTVRNPYTLMAAHFYMTHENSDIENLKWAFKEFLEINLYHNPRIKDILYNLNYVNVEYPIKIENLESSYMNLPIIDESDYYKKNQLSELLSFKYNRSSSALAQRPISDFYSKTSADLVYYSFSNYFDLFGYDKNSWKI